MIMNIVVACDFAYVNGGGAMIALGSAKGLAARGHQVTLFSGVGPVSDDLQHVPGLSHVCLDQHDVWRDPNRVRAAARSLWNQTAARRMTDVLATMDPTRTIVHVHSWTKALSSSVVRAASSRGFKVVTTLHDFLSVCPNGTLFDYSRGCQCQLRPLSTACVTTNCDARSYSHKLWRVGRQVLQQSVGRLPQVPGDFVAVSASSERMFRQLLPSSVRLHHVPNFTDVPRMDPVAVEHNDAVMYIGRLSAEKGPNLLAECGRRLNLKTVFVGSGELDAVVRDLCPSAEITGWLPSDRVRETLRQARVLVFPSLWFEVQGLVVAEAAAAGVPAIVPDTSAARDWVDDGRTGLWFRGGDVDDLCRKVTTMVEDPALAARMGRAAYQQFWSSPPTLDRHAERLESVYESVLASGGTA